MPLNQQDTPQAYTLKLEKNRKGEPRLDITVFGNDPEECITQLREELAS